MRWVMILWWFASKKAPTMECQSGKNSRRKKSHQNDYFKPRKYFLNQENIISYPRLFLHYTKNFIGVQDVLSTCVKMKIYMQE